MAKRLNMIDESKNSLLWVVDFPMFEYSEEEKRYVAMHHPFTAPKPEDVPLLESDPSKARARAYDLVLNGNEIAGGSIRIHTPELQSKVFGLLGITPEEAKSKFGFMLDAFRYGAPPHGGIAFGPRSHHDASHRGKINPRCYCVSKNEQRHVVNGRLSF